MSLNLRHDGIFGCSDKCLDNKIFVNFQRFSTPYPEVA